MKIKTSLRYVSALAILATAAVCASAQTGPRTGGPSSDSQLNITANASNALMLDISTAPGGATVNGTTGRNSNGVFSLDFGNVNGLGIGTPSTGVTVDVQETGALYTTPINLTPRYSGHTNNSASISVMLDGTGGNDAGRAATREGGAATSVTAPSASVPNIFTSGVTSGTSVTRYVGVFVSNANGTGAVAGSLQSRLIYQVTIP